MQCEDPSTIVSIHQEERKSVLQTYLRLPQSAFLRTSRLANSFGLFLGVVQSQKTTQRRTTRLLQALIERGKVGIIAKCLLLVTRLVLIYITAC